MLPTADAMTRTAPTTLSADTWALFRRNRLALAGLVYLSWLGPEGLREVGETCMALVEHAKERLGQLMQVQGKDHTQVTDAGLRDLAALEHLTHLVLKEAKVTDATAKATIGAPGGWPRSWPSGSTRSSSRRRSACESRHRASTRRRSRCSASSASAEGWPTPSRSAARRR